MAFMIMNGSNAVAVVWGVLESCSKWNEGNMR